MDTATNTLWTAPELAARLGVARHRVYDLIREGKIPGVVRLGHQIRIDPVAVEEWISKGGTRADG